MLTELRNTGGGAAIVFIHGFGGDAHATWGRFPEWLQAEPGLRDWGVYTLGYATRLNLDFLKLWSADPDLRKVALELVTEARFGVLAPFETLCLVAHSMGGLATQRALLDDAELRKRTSHVFLYGTPSGGLAKASWFRVFKPQLRDMARESPFITSLRADWSARFEIGASLRLPFQFFVTGGERDEFVPYESSHGAFPEALYRDRFSIVPGNHVEMVKPSDTGHLSVRVLVRGLTGGAATAGPLNAARLAVQSRRFRDAVESLDPHRDALDADGAVTLALALEGLGRQEDALALLRAHVGNSTDAMGTLAGRLKRRWLVSRVEADAVAALDLYRRALERAAAAAAEAQIYYHAINVAFMELAYRDDRAAAIRHAELARNACRACATSTERPAERKWRLATEGEAALIAGELPAACAAYREAAAPAQAAQPRELESMFRQAIVISRILGDEDMGKALTGIFRT